MKVLKLYLLFRGLLNFPQVVLFVGRKVVSVQSCVPRIHHVLFRTFLTLESL